MSFPRDAYPYTNFHELNLGYFIVHFREIFSQWADLYDQMLDWKDATTDELTAWKTGVEADLDQREAALRAELETWKAQTGQDIAGWEDATLAALTAWQTATQAVFEAIRVEAAGSATAAAASAGDATTAKTAAETAQAAAEAAAASIASSAAQIATNTSDIADLKTQLNLSDKEIFGEIDNTFPLKFENGTYQYTAVGKELIKYYSGGYDLTRKVVKSTVFNAPCNVTITAKSGYGFTVFTADDAVITDTSGVVTSYTLQAGKQYGITLRTTDGTGDISALSVDQIVEIVYESSIDALEAQTNRLEDAVFETNDINFDNETAVNGVIYPPSSQNAGKWNGSAIYKSYFISTNSADTVTVTANSAQYAVLGFLKSNTVSNGQPVPFCDGVTSRTDQTPNTTVEYDIPADCHYICVYKGDTNHTYTPASMILYGNKIPVVDNTLSVPGDAADAAVVGEAIAKAYSYRGTIVSNADSDVHKVGQPGIYSFTKTESTNIANMPGDFGEQSGFVIAVIYGTRKRLILFGNESSNCWYSSYISGWGDWLRLDYRAPYSSAFRHSITSSTIATTTTLAAYLLNGFYRIASSALSKITDLPDGLTAPAILEVFSYDTSTGAGTEQILIGNDGKMWLRTLSSGTGTWIGLNTVSAYTTKALIIGASIEAGTTHNKDNPSSATTNPDKAYLTVALRNNGVNVTNKSHGSMGWVKTSSSGGYTCKGIVDDVVANEGFMSYDCVYFCLGANDYSYSYPLGATSDAAGEDTLCGQLKYALETVYADNPGIKIFVKNMGGSGGDNGATPPYTQAAMETAIETICADYGVEVLVLDRILNVYNKTLTTDYYPNGIFPDGKHPCPEIMEQMARDTTGRITFK